MSHDTRSSARGGYLLDQSRTNAASILLLVIISVSSTGIVPASARCVRGLHSPV